MKLKSMKCLFSWASRIKPKITVSVLFLFLVLKLQFSPIMTPLSLIYHPILFRYHLSCYLFPNETFSLQLQLFVSPYFHSSFSFVSFWSVQPFCQSHLPLWLPFVSLLGAALWLILIAFATPTFPVTLLPFSNIPSNPRLSRLTRVFDRQFSNHCFLLNHSSTDKSLLNVNQTFRMNHKHESLC